jgi:hypothetical protein
MSPRIARCSPRDLLPDTRNVVIGIEKPNRGVDMVEIDDQHRYRTPRVVLRAYWWAYLRVLSRRLVPTRRKSPR